MILNIYLDDTIVDVLKCYGTLDVAVNRILQCGTEGLIDIMNKPTAPPKTNGRQYVINITEPGYLGLYNIYGPKSSKISLRRLIYWFVNNELYEELAWEPTEQYADTHNDKILALIGDMRVNLFKINKLCPGYKDEVNDITSLLWRIEAGIWNDGK